MNDPIRAAYQRTFGWVILIGTAAFGIGITVVFALNRGTIDKVEKEIPGFRTIMLGMIILNWVCCYCSFLSIVCSNLASSGKVLWSGMCVVNIAILVFASLGANTLYG